jgi:hypothetical protein
VDTVKCTALLNSESKGHFVTERLVQQHHLRKCKAHVPVPGINEVINQFIMQLHWKQNPDLAVGKPK